MQPTYMDAALIKTSASLEWLAFADQIMGKQLQTGVSECALPSTPLPPHGSSFVLYGMFCNVMVRQQSFTLQDYYVAAVGGIHLLCQVDNARPRIIFPRKDYEARQNQVVVSKIYNHRFFIKLLAVMSS